MNVVMVGSSQRELVVQHVISSVRLVVEVVMLSVQLVSRITSWWKGLIV